MSITAEQFAAQLGGKRSGSGWVARCPAHEDKRASLSISTGDNGMLLAKCHAGCTFDDVLKAAPDVNRGSQVAPATERQARVTNVYTYQFTDGKTALKVHRKSDKTFFQSYPNGKPEARPIYRLPEVMGAGDGSFVFLAEGEKDTDRLFDEGLVGTTTSMGAGNASKTDLSPLHGRHVVILPDNDEPGEKYAAEVAGILKDKAASVRILKLAVALPGGDVSDWFNAGGDAEDLVRMATAEDLVRVSEISDTAPATESQARPLTIGDLIQNHPKLSDPVIDGLLRSGETGNIIAASKVGKSWLMYDLLISIATGRRWLDSFQCSAGRVLLIDNELHPQTIANRLPKVAKAMGVSMVDLDNSIDVLPLRGKGITLDRLAAFINEIEPGTYACIVMDAWYRFIPKGLSENSNADIMGLYNLLDQYAASTGSAIVAVHHASKGAQGDKAVTDVGAGAGAQSRAADAHIVLRPHEDEGCVVLEAAVRSFKPIEPVGLRWEFPTWQRADLDTGALKDRKTKLEHKREQNDTEGIAKIVDKLRSGPLTPRKIRDATGLSKGRADRLLSRMIAGDIVTFAEVKLRGQPTREYTLAD